MGRRVHICFNTSTTFRRSLTTKLLEHVRSSPSWKPDTTLEDTEGMKPRHLLPLAAAAASAAALPEDATRPQTPMKIGGEGARSLMWQVLPTRDDILTTIDGAVDYIGGAVLNTAGAATRSGRRVMGHYSGSEATKSETTAGHLQYAHDASRPGQKGGIDQSTNMSVIEIIHQSNQATYFAHLLKSYNKLRDMLDDAKKDFTVFVPTDEAFRKLEGFEKSEGALLGEILEYHVLEGRHPASKLRGSRTLPTVLEERELGGRRQRLRIAEGRSGVEVNFYGRVVDAESKEGRNGVVHYVDSVLVPPPRHAALVDSLPEQLGTFSRALKRTKLSDELRGRAERGVTLFAPSNEAWERLGEDARRFLFSEAGVAHLKALVRYHVAEDVVYADADRGSAEGEGGEQRREVQTLLGGTISVGVGRWKGSRLVRVNGVAVSVRDVPARDGVMHVVDEVLLPPATETGDMMANEGRGRTSVQELKRQLGRFMKGGDEVESEEL
ncbi:aurofusarin biosynthesis cluster protein S [Colletotrichum liriopes]|uniref:Aurofusarin biosynthesis cluster protein S n=1 Tax=Colletotrichum liriopes TaxID=708192 RepID=A0AA37LTS3_9PEZI|nr:aurofusarin biosynthesis cluster protein S [Colletotrichum liriopes]